VGVLSPQLVDQRSIWLEKCIRNIVIKLGVRAIPLDERLTRSPQAIGRLAIGIFEQHRFEHQLYGDVEQVAGGLMLPAEGSVTAVEIELETAREKLLVSTGCVGAIAAGLCWHQVLSLGSMARFYSPKLGGHRWSRRDGWSEPK
jgi:hypothetical protein